MTAHIVLHDQKILPQHLLKGFPFVSASRPSNKKSVDGHVSNIIEKDTFPRSSVPARSAGLLIIILHAPGQIIVNDETHIRLVDPHAERAGRDDQADTAPDPVFLTFFPFAGRKPPMVEGCRDPVLIELFGERFRSLPCETVDNAGPGPVFCQNAEELCPFVLRVPDFEIQIRPVEPCRERCGLFEMQIRNDLLPHGRCRGSRERTNRRTTFQAVCEIPDLSIGGAKVPAPVRDTVGFVDCEERDVCIFRK